MTAAPETGSDTAFIDRRATGSLPPGRAERRQFGNSHRGLSPAALELAEAIDGYKVQHRRRYITFEEMLRVIQSLGYSKTLQLECATAGDEVLTAEASR